MIKTWISLVCCILMFSFVACSVYGQRDDDLERQKITINMEGQPLGLILRYLMEQYQIPVGFEESILDRDISDYNFSTNLPSKAEGKVTTVDGTMEVDIEIAPYFKAEKHPITVKVVNGNVSDVFDQIVPQMKNYKWEISDGVVNIYPTSGRDKRFKQLLDTEIANFDLADGKTVQDISFQILKLREFGKWSGKNQLYFSPFRQGSVILVDAQYGRKINSKIHLSSITFRKLLNEVTKIKGGGWSLRLPAIGPNGEGQFDLDI